MADTEDRTEAATPRRLERARADGQVPLTREAAGAAVLGSAALVLAMAGPDLAARLAHHLAGFLDHAATLDPFAAMREAASLAVTFTAPFALAALLAGSAAVLLQTGFLLNLGALQPNLGRLDPRRGLSRVLGSAALLETGRSLLKLAAIVGAVWLALGLPRFDAAMQWDPSRLAGETTRQIVRVLLAIVVTQSAIATLDLIRARFKHARDLRMSRQELRDEHRESEGDPRIKGRIKQIRQQRARQRLIEAMPKATVVVTNPTHYAVALAYDRAAGAAPRVVAKGLDEMAARIRTLAAQHRVPVVANPPLARALYVVELDREIPAEHYQAVAELIAYVWRLRERAR